MELGEVLPNFTLKNQHGALVDSSNLIGLTPIVVFFYPKNFTPGCTKEVCGFRDHFEDFSEMGATVVGISADSEASHQKFAKRFQLPFDLLADTKNKVRKQFGVKSNLLGMLPGRETFVFDANGKLTYKVAALGADPHIKKALKHLQR